MFGHLKEDAEAALLALGNYVWGIIHMLPWASWPAAHFWFSGTALFLACSFVFTVLIGLIGIKKMISRPTFWILIAFALVLSGLAWRTAAQQQSDEVENNAKITKMQATLDKIANSANVSPNQSVDDIATAVIAKFQPLQKQVDALSRGVESPEKRSAMKELLHTSISDGEALSKDWFNRTDADAYLREANLWANKTGHLIEDAYGKGEADVWESDAGLINYVDPRKPTMPIHNGIVNRLQRLNELMSRVDTLSMRPEFDPENYHWRECDDATLC
jgi:hypothetical protein